jgi:hypothetical protein
MPSPLRSFFLRRHVPALVVAAVGAVVYLIWQPASNDLSVQHFRFELFRRAPFAIWNNQWFAGHHTPGYSLIVPMIGSVLGPVVLGVLCTIGGAWVGSVLIHRLVERHPDLRRPQVAACLFAVGCLSSLYGGRTTFMVGVVVAVVALLAAISRPWWSTALLAMVCAVSSPVAGLFLVLIGCAVVASRSLPRQQGLALVLPPLVAIGGLAVLFPEGGDFPFPIGGVVNLLLVTALVAVAGRRYSFLRWACAGYAAFVVLCAVVPTPVGGNAARLLALVAPAVLVLVAVVPVALLTALLAVPMLVLQWSPVSAAVTLDEGQSEKAFFQPLLTTLQDQSAPMRVEVVPLATHGEADWVALEVPIARGWNRQLDRKYNALFYADSLSANQYRDWLVDTGVGFVAIADATLDSAGRLEEQLLADPPPYLREIHRDDVWRVFAVEPRPEMADGDASVTELGVDSFRVLMGPTRPVTVRVRFSPWFRVVDGEGCVSESSDGWTVVDAAPGEVRVRAELSLGAVVDRDGDC